MKIICRNPHEWNRWFAWRPVRVDELTICDKPDYRWLCWIKRTASGTCYDSIPSWRYRDIEK